VKVEILKKSLEKFDENRFKYVVKFGEFDGIL